MLAALKRFKIRGLLRDVFLSQGGAISWYSKRLTLSAVEAELMAISIASQEAIWLQDLVYDLGLISGSRPIPIFSDSRGAFKLAKNGNYSP